MGKATPRSAEEINRLMGSSVEPLPAPLERPSRWPALLVSLVATGLLVYALDKTSILFGELLMPKTAYVTGGIGIALLFVAEWLWLRD